MFSLVAWVRGLVALVMFVALVEMVSPSGKLRKFIELVVGLAVVVALLEPLGAVLRTGLARDSWDAGEWGLPDTFGRQPLLAQEESWQVLGNRMVGRAAELAISSTAFRFGTQVSDLVRGLPGVSDAGAEAVFSSDGRFERVVIELVPGGDENETAHAVRQAVQDSYGLSPEQVEVRVQRGR